MARGTQLLELVAQLRAETGRSQDVSVGVDEVENLKQILRRTQAVLYEGYDWPHMNAERSIALANGQRYYDMPSDLNVDRIEVIKYKYNNVYTDLTRGINFDNYSIFDSNADERSSPAINWDVRHTGTTEQIEIWPIPNAVNSVHFFGTKSLNPLIQESDRAELDDHLIVLSAAFEILSRQKSTDAKLKGEQFNNRLLILRRNSQAGSRTVQVGQGNSRKTNRHETKIIVS